jgi:hypothetical protein
MTVSGGVSAVTYALTGSAASDLGNLRLPDVLAKAFQAFHGYAAPGWARRPQFYNTLGGNGQFTAQVRPTVQVTLTSNLFHSLQQRSSLDQLQSLLQSAVDSSVAYLKNDFVGIVPLRNANAYERATVEQLTFNNALQVSWAPWQWLPLMGTAGLNIGTGHDMTLLERGIVPYTGFSDTLGRYGVGQTSAMMKTVTVHTTIPGVGGRLQTALGFNLTTQNTSDVTAKQDTLAVGVKIPSRLYAGTQSITGTATYGWFFEPRFTLSQRFYLTPGFRLDGGNANGGRASVAGVPSKLSFAALFPKVNFSWIALDRQEGEAAPLFGVLTLLRPRLALGSAGVQPTPGDQLRLLGPAATGTGSTTNGDTLFIQTLGNTRLKPERSFETEVGADAEAWHGRAMIGLTVARKMTHDAIIDVPLAPSVLGDNWSIKLNVGEVRNTNVELTASLKPVETGMMSWTIGGNFSHNDNEVLKINQNSRDLVQFGGIYNSGEFTISNTKIAVGYPLFGRWAKPILGYADVSGDGIIQLNEIRLGDTAVFLGQTSPTTMAALNTDLTFFHGRVGVHANFAYQGGYSQLNGAGGATGTFLSVANDPTASFGQQASYVAAQSVSGIEEGTLIGLAQTVSYWRFQSLSLNYEVPRTIAELFRSSRMSVALQGSNLHLWSNYRGKDPNVNALPNSNNTLDAGGLPQPRKWSVKLTLGN